MKKPFISYAQNSEDVVLYRVFKNIKKGYYVDIGAADPINSSVTKSLYDRGWSGINIDILPYEIEKYSQLRKRDINLNIGIGREKGHLTYYEYPNCPGNSSFSRELVDERKKSNPKLKFVNRDIEVISLNDIFETNYSDMQVHLLKIDVEGFEDEIIYYFNWKKFRPLFIVIEKNKNYLKWIPFLKKQKYIFCLNDGLNLFFVREEGKNYKELLANPAYCVDNLKRK